MARNNYSAGKRQRERDKARKKKEKSQRRRDNRGSTGSGIPIATVDEIQGGLMTAEEVLASVHGRGGVEERANRIPSRLFVGGLNWRVTTEQLRKKLEEFGSVADAFIVTDRETGDSRGFGFVTMEDRKDAARAIRELNGEEFEGRNLVVRQATERQR